MYNVPIHKRWDLQHDTLCVSCTLLDIEYNEYPEYYTYPCYKNPDM